MLIYNFAGQMFLGHHFMFHLFCVCELTFHLRLSVAKTGRLETVFSTYRSSSIMSVVVHLLDSKSFKITAFKMKGEQMAPNKTDLKR